MAKRETKRAGLAQVQQWLSSWREEFGGRGRPIPDELWDAAAAVAETEGVARTAQALRLDRSRLARRARVETPTHDQQTTTAGPKFVELGPLGAFGVSSVRQQVVIYLRGEGRVGRQLMLEGSASDVAAVIRQLLGAAL